MATASVSEVRKGLSEQANTDFNMAERVVLMCASALFTGLSQEELVEIAACSEARTFARDELLFMQGQQVRNLVLIQTGSVKVTQLSASGNESLLWMNGTGETVGAHHTTPTCTHSCSARAMERCTSLIWKYAQLQDLMAEFPQIRSNISQILLSRLTELEERFREVATERVAKRVAHALLRLLKQVGKPTEQGIEVSLSREELAQMTGCTLFTVSRLLSAWGEEGFVLPKREAVVVLDARRLALAGEIDN
jgi:CRP-like cAMP-binding protein